MFAESKKVISRSAGHTQNFYCDGVQEEEQKQTESDKYKEERGDIVTCFYIRQQKESQVYIMIKNENLSLGS